MGFLIQFGLAVVGLWMCIALPLWVIGVVSEIRKANQ